MPLNDQDRHFIEVVKNALKTELERNIKFAGVEEFDGTLVETRAHASVEISKDDLRKASGRTRVRDAYLAEVADAFNGKGLSANVEQDRLVVTAVPAAFEDRVLTINELMRK